MNRKELKAMAKQSLKQPGQIANIAKMYVIPIIFGVATGIFIGIGLNFENIIGKLAIIIGWVGLLATTVVGITVGAGILDMLVTNVKYGRTITFEDWMANKDIKLYWKIFGYNFVIQFASSIATGILGIIPILGAIASFILTIVINTRIIFVTYIKLDHPEMGLVDTAKLSFNLAGGLDVKSILDVVVLYLTFIPWFFAMCIPVFGQVYAMPYIQLTFTQLYFAKCKEMGVDSPEEVKAETFKLAGTFGSFAAKAKTENKEKVEKTDKKEKKAFPSLKKTEESPTQIIYDTMVQSIRGKAVVNIIWKGDKVRALPIDIVTKNGEKIYNFFIQTPEGIKPVQIREVEISDITPNGKTFNPAQYVTWQPHWVIDRDWGI